MKKSKGRIVFEVINVIAVICLPVSVVKYSGNVIFKQYSSCSWKSFYFSC